MKRTKPVKRYTKSDFERFMNTGQAPKGIHNGAPKVVTHTHTKYDIEKGVPIPEYFRVSEFPLLDMEVGDSFVAPLHKIKALRNAINRIHKRNETFKFITRTVTGRGRAGKQTRVWRVAS